MNAYTIASVTAIVVAVLVDLLVLRTNVLRTKAFWASYAIILFFQFIVNGILTGLGIVQYDPKVYLGIRLFWAPIEDIGFGFGLIVLSLSVWVRLGRSRSRPSHPTRPDRSRPTGTTRAAR